MKRKSPLVEHLSLKNARDRHLRLTRMISRADKLGDPAEVGAFNLPLDKTCCADPRHGRPTASALCCALCYLWKMIEGRLTVMERSRLNWEIAKRGDFAYLLAGAIIRAALRFFRLHDFGDFFSTAYIEEINRVIRICDHVAFWCYTRAWRHEEFIEPLTRLAAMSNMSVLLSADRHTGMPPNIPNTRVAWLADNDAEAPPEKVHVVFRATRERTPDGYCPVLRTLGGSPVCVHEDGVYSPTALCRTKSGRFRKRKVGPPDCVSCGRCMFKTRAACTVDEFALGRTA